MPIVQSKRLHGKLLDEKSFYFEQKDEVRLFDSNLVKLIQVVAGCPVAGADFLQLGYLASAALVSIGAAGAETAAAGGIDRAGNITLQNDTLGSTGSLGVCNRDSGDKAAGVGMDIMSNQLIAVSQLNQLT